MFTYYWGDLRVSVASRFGLMFLPLIVISSTFLLARLTEEFRLSRSYAVVLAVALIAFYWPFAMESRTSAHRTSFREFHTNLAYLEQHFPERKNLIIFDTPSWYVPYRWSAVTGRFANQNRQALMKALRRSEIPNMLVLQVIRYADGRPTQESVDLDRGFELETLFESQVSPTSYTRISRVKP
jgi:hypothetical protein